MAYLKKYGLGLAYTIGGIIISLLVVTIFYYFDIISNQVYQFFKLFIVLINIFVGSFMLGKRSTKNGYLEGIKFGAIILSLMFVPTIIMAQFKIRLLIYYSTIVFTSTLGGMVGISRKGKIDNTD